VKLYTKVAYKFTGKPKREEIYEYPLEAIREAVINSVMHRDYFEKGHNNILRFFPDRILIENVWIEPKGFEFKTRGQGERQSFHIHDAIMMQLDAIR